MYFRYGTKETEYLQRKDKRLARVIAQLGFIKRYTDSDLFASVVHHIVGQQISSKAQATVWARLESFLGAVTPAAVDAASAQELQSLGISMRKAEYIKDFAAQVQKGQFSLEAVAEMSDADAIAALSSLKGIGVWTAEMILLFCLQRQDILSYGDLAIQRGLRMLYGHKKITPTLFARYQKRYSPYGSVAALYLWAVAGGALAELRDPAAAIKNIGRQKEVKAVPYQYYQKIASPLGMITVTSDGENLTGLWFEQDRHHGDALLTKAEQKAVPVFAATEKWLSLYFEGQEPDFLPPIKLHGSKFQLQVWEILQSIPYGGLLTYKEVAQRLAQQAGIPVMAAQAVGGAVGRNPVCILVPCHRVVGANGSLTGYGGGIQRKVKLLQLEKVDMKNLYVPEKGTAL